MIVQADDRANDRCPRCGALVRPAAQWCTLCYADLRPASEPVTEVETPALAPTAPTAPTAPPAGPAQSRSFGTDRSAPKHASAPFDPLTAPLALLERPAEAPPDGSASSSATDAEAPETLPPSASATWPCSRCQATVALEETTCPDCGAPFLVSDASSGRLHELTASAGTKVAIMIGGSVVVGIVFFAVLFIIAELG